MSPIDPLGPFLAQIRAQAVAWKRQDPKRAADAAGREGEGTSSPTELLQGVITAVSAIPADVPDRPRRAFRLYLQAVLARELGIRDVHASDVQELLDRVLRGMEEDVAVGEAMERAGAWLVQQAAR